MTRGTLLLNALAFALLAVAGLTLDKYGICTPVMVLTFLGAVVGGVAHVKANAEMWG
ncbi:hypothetical protein HLB42_21685 (plasmid) [Deinococcus sp. D7000]|nr:hypothetical protein HLB42_13960 [Deinococcus sp. D7000]QLG13554.1 hypothetical protein HLB42_21685 [Deinococcus sp. D7000]